MKAVICSVGGRAPPRRKPPRTSGSRWPAAARGPRAPASSAAPARRWSAPTAAVIGLGPADPPAQRLRRDAELVGDRADRGPLGGVLILVLEHQPDGSLSQLLGVPAWSRHGSNLSRVGASRNPTLLANSSCVTSSVPCGVCHWAGGARWLEVDDVVASERFHPDSRRDGARCSGGIPEGLPGDACPR